MVGERGREIGLSLAEHAGALGRSTADDDMQLHAEVVGIGPEQIVLIAVTLAPEDEIAGQAIFDDHGQPAALAHGRHPDIAPRTGCRKKQTKEGEKSNRRFSNFCHTRSFPGAHQS